VPWSWLRATQFHDFLAHMIAGRTQLPVLPAPAIRYQPVDRGEVAAALVDAVEAGPAGRLPDFAGPKALLLADFARIWSAAQGRSRLTLTIPLPGSLGRRLREGALCNVDRAVGRTNFRDWATRQVRGESVPDPKDQTAQIGRARGLAARHPLSVFLASMFGVRWPILAVPVNADRGLKMSPGQRTGTRQAPCNWTEVGRAPVAALVALRRCSVGRPSCP